MLDLYLLKQELSHRLIHVMDHFKVVKASEAISYDWTNVFRCA